MAPIAPIGPSGPGPIGNCHKQMEFDVEQFVEKQNIYSIMKECVCFSFFFMCVTHIGSVSSWSNRIHHRIDVFAGVG